MKNKQIQFIPTSILKLAILENFLQKSFYLRNPDFHPLTMSLLMIRFKVFYTNVTK